MPIYDDAPMEITPRELRDTEIHSEIRGYSRDEVNDLLEKAAAAIEASNQRVTQLQDRLTSAQSEAVRTRETEDILHRTLLLAQRAADEAVGEATAKSRQMLDDAEIQAKRVVADAKVMAETLMSKGFDVVSGGTDNHLMLIDLTNKNVSGKIAAKALDKAGIELNYNAVPYDTRKPFDPSGIRLGSPSVASRGMGEAEMRQIALWIDRVVSDPTDATAAKVLSEVLELTSKFPAPGISL